MLFTRTRASMILSSLFRWEKSISFGFSAIESISSHPYFPLGAKFSALISLGIAHFHIFDFYNSCLFLKEAEQIAFLSGDVSPSPIDALSTSNSLSCPYAARLYGWLGLVMIFLFKEKEAIDYLSKVLIPNILFIFRAFRTIGVTYLYNRY